MFKLSRFLRPYKLSVIAVLGLVFLQSMAELLLPTLMANIVDIGIVNGDTSYILRIGMTMLLIALAGTLCAVISRFLSATAAMSFGRDLRNAVFTRVENYSLNEFDQIGTSSLITRTTNDINQAQQITIMSLRMMIRAPMMAAGGIIMAVSRNAQLSLVIVFVIPIIALAIALVAKKGTPIFKKVQTKLDRLNQILREYLSGVRVIRAFNRLDYERERFQEANLDLTHTAIAVNKIMSVMMPAMSLVLNFTIIAVIWFGSLLIDKNAMQVGDLMAFIQYVMQILFSLLMVSMIFVMIPRAAASAERINEVLDLETEIVDPTTPEHPRASRGFIEFQNVSFSYPGAEKPVLKNISFTAEPHKTTAIIGGTGAGKSTLIKLILRFYDLDSGKILIDGVDIKNMTQETLRKKVGYIPQRAVLFSGTIADNIKYGKEDATEEEILKAMEIAQAAEFVFQMEEGLDSTIAQGGTNISGGQKQRLSIARALVRKPEIYLIDDGFSALDFKTDAKLRTALEDETKGATMIIVTQRVSTILDAQQIIVMDEGEIRGIGTHRELLQSSSIYKEIVSSQLSEEEIA